MTLRARITGTGSSLPERIVTNHEMEKLVDTSDEWIATRTGIRERRIAAEGDKLSDYAARASVQALAAAGGADGPMDPESLDLILCATVTPDWHLPATACFLQSRIGAKCPAFDLSAGCSGFVYALAVADAFIRSGSMKRILVVGGELLSKYINWQDRATCVIFADGAGAVILESHESGSSGREAGILQVRMHADGGMADLISIPGGGTEFPPSHAMIDKGQHLIHMKGNETFKLAVKGMTEAANAALEANDVSASDLALLVPHQANLRIIEATAQRLHLPMSKVFVNIERYGNTSGATIPIALDEAVREGRVAPGDLVLLDAFGAGFTWGAALIRW